MRHCLKTIVRTSLPEPVWKPAALSIRLRGLGLQEAISTATAAFIGSCNAVRWLSAQLLKHTSLQVNNSCAQTVLSFSKPLLNNLVSCYQIITVALTACSLKGNYMFSSILHYDHHSKDSCCLLQPCMSYTLFMLNTLERGYGHYQILYSALLCL